jgi:CheY-like chemotaxis protein
VNMNVVTCGSLPEMLEHLQVNMPDIIVVNPSYDIEQGLRFIGLLKQQYPGLPLITIGQSILESHLDAMMKAGVSFHINRQFTQPRDILLAIEEVLSR